MDMNEFLKAMVVLVIPSVFVVVLVGGMLYRRWKAEQGEAR